MSYACLPLIQDHAWVSYNTSKSAVLQMARSMACELGPKRIRVNTLSPGHIYTTYVIAHEFRVSHASGRALVHWATRRPRSSLVPMLALHDADEGAWHKPTHMLACTGVHPERRAIQPESERRTRTTRVCSPWRASASALPNKATREDCFD